MNSILDGYRQDLLGRLVSQLKKNVFLYSTYVPNPPSETQFFKDAIERALSRCSDQRRRLMEDLIINFGDPAEDQPSPLNIFQGRASCAIIHHLLHNNYHASNQTYPNYLSEKDKISPISKQFSSLSPDEKVLVAICVQTGAL